MASFMKSMDLSSDQANVGQGSEGGKGTKNSLNLNISRANSTNSSNVPLSTPRRRLRQALDLEKAICQKLEQQGWNMVIRAGKKIGSIYALVTGYAKFPDVRLAVYQTNNSRIQEILFKSDIDLNLCTTSVRKSYINNYLKQYTFNEQGDLIRIDATQETNNNQMEVDNDNGRPVENKNDGSKTETHQEQQIVDGLQAMHV